MKQLMTLLVAMLVFGTAWSKEKMTLLSGEELEVEIVTIGTNDIEYKKLSNPTGPTYKVAKNKVFYIVFDDGTKEVITPLDQSGSVQPLSDVGSGMNAGTIGGAVSGMVMAADTVPEERYFDKISFMPRAMFGFHATPSGYKDQYDIDWGGFSWAFDLNMLFPSGNASAWSIGLGLCGLEGTMNQLYTSGNKNHKDKMGDFSTMYFTIPLEYWYKFSRSFMFGVGMRLDILVSQKCEGEKIKDAFNVCRFPFMLDGIYSIGKFDIGAQVLFNLTSAMKGEDLDWSPTIGVGVTVGYRF